MKDSIIYGTHAVKEALDAGKELIKIQVMKGIFNPALDELLKAARGAQVPVQTVPKEKFFNLKDKNHQGVMAFASPITYHSLEQIVPALFEQGETPFILILDSIKDVRNLGAIARTALCAGVHALVVPLTNAAPVNEDAVKTSAGALHKLPVCREKHLKTTLEYLNQSGFSTVACTEKGKDSISQTDLTGPLAIVMGNEETGISPELLKKCSALAQIPMNMGVSSLNVSVAAGIILYEALMQRT